MEVAALGSRAKMRTKEGKKEELSSLGWNGNGMGIKPSPI
jgi:hypothetical protein